MNHQFDAVPAALHARVSSDRQDVDLFVAAQLRTLCDFAERNKCVVAREYVDEAESGRIADRPQFQQMLDEARAEDSPFQEVLVGKFSRLTRKRKHAVAFKSMLRRRDIRITSITEHADDTPTGKLMEAIIESVAEVYSENLAQEVKRGIREAASRGFWVAPRAPYGYRKVHVQDGAKKRPRLELNSPVDAVVRRIFDMALGGQSVLDITRTLNAEGIPTTNGKPWLKTTVHRPLTNETCTDTLIWGQNAKDGAPPVRVEDAFPAIISRELVKLVDEAMDGLAHGQREQLATIEHQLAELKRMLDRIWRAIETTDLEVADAADRLREHKQRKEQLELAAAEARKALAARRQLLDSTDAIAKFAAEMREFLLTSDITETKAFIRTFVKRITVRPGRAVIRYTIPMPEDSPLGRSDAAEVALSGGVMSSVRVGGPGWIRTSDRAVMSRLL